MKNPVRSLLAVAAFGAVTMIAQAQPAPKIMVVDMAKLYDNHYKTEEQNAKLRGDEQKAQEELDKLNKEGNALVEQYKELAEQAQNPAATAEAKQKAEAAARQKLEDINRKRNEVESFRVNTTRSLQQRVQNFKTIMLEEISKLATDVAKKKGATMLMDKSGPSLIGVPSLIYTDAGYDITDDVMKEINSTRPAASAAAPAAAPAAPAPAATGAKPGESPTITVPGAGKK